MSYYDIDRALSRDLDAREAYDRSLLPLRRPTRVGYYIRCATCLEIKPYAERSSDEATVTCVTCAEAENNQTPCP